jgi:flagellar P-ring protein precursor FlgI
MRHALALLLAAALATPAAAQSRIKDVARVEGVRDNALVGYGVVVGLAGTGDSGSFPAAGRSLRDMLNRMGAAAADQTIQSRAAAAVMVSATLPPFARPGARIDVAVAVMGDSGSLRGGVLQPTALAGPDGQVYAVAQGPVSLGGGFSAGGASQSVVRGVASTASIPGGAVVERAAAFDFSRQASLTISLLNPDFSLARQVAQAINGELGADVAHAKDNANIEVTVPASYTGRTADLMADIENLLVRPSQPGQPGPPARVVIDDRTGTIVLGEQVRISTVAVNHGNLTVRVTETPQVSQPAPFSSGGSTVVVPRTTVDVGQGSGRLVVLPAGATIGELVNSLNSIRVSVADQIAILQAIRRSGALQADLVTTH